MIHASQLNSTQGLTTDLSFQLARSWTRVLLASKYNPPLFAAGFVSKFRHA